MAEVKRAEPIPKADAQRWAITLEEELEIDQEALSHTIALMPQKMGLTLEEIYQQEISANLGEEGPPDKPGITYDELVKRVEPFKQPETAKMPMLYWLSTSLMYEIGPANEALKDEPELADDVRKFTSIFSRQLAEITAEKGLTSNFRIFVPYYMVPESALPRLLRRPTHLAVPTHPYTGPMRRALLSKNREMLTEEVKVRENGKVNKRQVRARLDLPHGVEPAQMPHEIMQRLYKDLLKSRDTSLLKVHMDLTHQGFLTKSLDPEIVYDLNEAAERLGLEVQSHGSYHTDSIKAIYNRIVALTFHYVDVYKVKDRRRGEQIFDAPYWRIKYRGRAEAGEEIDGNALLFDRPDIIRTLIVEPGGWWQPVGMSEGYYFHLPAELLKLTTDSRSETNHMAVRIAAELSVWERINNKRPKPVVREVGKLLEGAGVTTFNEMAAKHRKQQKRLREYLAGTESEGEGQQMHVVGGALGLLRDHGAFDIEVEDEKGFWASGHGWFEKFWNSRLKLSVKPYVNELEGKN